MIITLDFFKSGEWVFLLFIGIQPYIKINTVYNNYITLNCPLVFSLCFKIINAFIHMFS